MDREPALQHARRSLVGRLGDLPDETAILEPPQRGRDGIRCQSKVGGDATGRNARFPVPAPSEQVDPHRLFRRRQVASDQVDELVECGPSSIAWSCNFMGPAPASISRPASTGPTASPRARNGPSAASGPVVPCREGPASIGLRGRFRRSHQGVRPIPPPLDGRSGLPGSDTAGASAILQAPAPASRRADRRASRGEPGSTPAEGPGFAP